MLSSLGAWLSRLDPNIAVPLLLSVAAFLYHSLLSPSAQAKLASAVKDAIDLASKAVDAALALSPAGMTAAQLEAELLNVAKAQLAHAGLDPDKLPPVVLSLVRAIVNAAIAKRQTASSPTPIATMAVTVAPRSPESGKVNLSIIATMAIGSVVAALLGVPAVAMSVTGCGAGQVALKTGQCILDSGVLDTVWGDLGKSDYAQLVADLETKVGPKLVDCALTAIAGGATGSTTVIANETGSGVVDRTARARELLAKRSPAR